MVEEEKSKINSNLVKKDDAVIEKKLVKKNFKQPDLPGRTI